MWFRVIKMMRRGNMQKSLRTSDISSKPAIKGKAGHSPGKHSLWSPDHGLATCSQESSGCENSENILSCLPLERPGAKLKFTQCC